ncbi:citrulline utilization hydrolase CtlX [Pedobacter puniceum]|uniref:Amidinotransferase n=1 Tax=Pedobacter puniceum TaxID=2666136 RepID=A0A7K0FL86_9SPHI|nr:arginine deiminase-related protein [Pedobacter puniceum]MRX46401.1 amidinotransferase [Pedobacter puniceum]
MQTTSQILMIRPVAFALNQQTLDSNAFQDAQTAQEEVQEKALKEFDAFVEVLRANKLNINIIQDTLEPHTPDSIFPNNWISFHENGEIFLYPMLAENRRQERRLDIIESLKKHYQVKALKDLSFYEKEHKFLEGTGSMVLDRENKIAYACLSARTHQEVLHEFCKQSGYTAMMFHAEDDKGLAIYHTNVMMCVAPKFAVVCLAAVKDLKEQQLIKDSLSKTGKLLIEISLAQMNQFAGNMLALQNTNGEHLLVMSRSAYNSLNPKQIQEIEQFVKIVEAPLETIEKNGGGSARCMIAEVHLPSL